MPPSQQGSTSGVRAGQAIRGFLGGIFGRGRRNQQNQPSGVTGDPKAEAQAAFDQSIEGRIQPVAGATADLEAAGQRDLERGEEAIATNRADAQELAGQQERGQKVAAGAFDRADTAAQQGLEDIQSKIEGTREEISRLPGEVQVEFDRQQQTLTQGMDAARVGLGGQRSEALANVMQGRGSAMDAAVASIQGVQNDQIAAINAQVQQGTLSPSQASLMKSKVKMASPMQLSAAVGQTAHMFTQTQAQVATSFGNMFTQFESTASSVQGQFGAAAGGAFASAQTASAQFNTALTGMDTQATAHRDAVLSQNAAARGAFQNANDVHNMNMLDYTQDQFMMHTPVAMNNLTSQRDLAGDYIKTDQGQQMLDLMRENQELTRQGGWINMLMSMAQFV